MRRWEGEKRGESKREEEFEGGKGGRGGDKGRNMLRKGERGRVKGRTD